VKTNGKQRLPDRAQLDYAPDNEQGVIYLFSHLARKRFGLRIERVQAGFPDCIAYQGEKRIRIEFEFRSRNFRDHRHPALDVTGWYVGFTIDHKSPTTRSR